MIKRNDDLSFNFLDLVAFHFSLSFFYSVLVEAEVEKDREGSSSPITSKSSAIPTASNLG